MLKRRSRVESWCKHILQTRSLQFCSRQWPRYAFIANTVRLWQLDTADPKTFTKPEDVFQMQMTELHEVYYITSYITSFSTIMRRLCPAKLSQAVSIRSASRLYTPVIKSVDQNHFQVNPLNPELNPIWYLLALLGAHHFLHVSMIRVKSLTLRLLMSYIYGAPALDVSRPHTTTQHSR